MNTTIPILKKALNHRFPLPENGAVRLFHRETDGLAGLAIDFYAGWLVIHAYDEKTLEQIPEITAFLNQELKPSGIYLKNRIRDTRGIYQEQESRPYLGEASPEDLKVEENGFVMLVNPAHGINAGLFMDQRDNRQWLLEQFGRTEGHLLNGFCYTGAFSIAFARHGWKTTSVDIAQPALDRVKANFEANQLSMDGHRIVREDFSAYCQRLIKRETRFDGIVVDPPTMARNSKGKVTFQLKRDVPDLAQMCLRLLNPGGFLLFTCNEAGLNQWEFSNWFELPAGFRVRSELPGQPADYPRMKGEGHLKGILIQKGL